MKQPFKLTCIALIFAPALSLAAEVHRDVAKAIDYGLPELTCDKPTLPGKGKDVVDSNGSVNRDDVDNYALGRYKRAEKRWMKCLTKYKEGLMSDFETLRNSATHGLTETQAKLILSNMANIQAVLIAPDGIPTPEVFANP
ncbi:MAG: hypothetical protein ACJAX5_003556 [Patiriisocius sp.]|jgi:hypothetical protein